MSITSLNIADGTVGRKLWPRLKRKYIIGTAIILLIIILIVLAYCTDVFSPKQKSQLVPPNPTKPLPPSASKMYVYKKAAVCSDGPPCAEIGKNILDRNGSAIDATIASMFCNGIVTMQSMGLGGGFLMTIYIREEKKAYFLNARETAPLNAKSEMYKNDEKLSRNGHLSIAVPGELKGYWTAYKRFGKLPWKELIQPSIELCEKGYNMTNHQYMSLFKNKLHDDPNFKEWFYDENNKFKKAGSKIVPTKLCQTLKLIAENGGDDLYNGTLSKMLLEDLNEVGSIITKRDLEEYEAEWMEPISVTFNNEDQLFSAPPPGSGALLGFILKILDGYNFNKYSLDGINNTVLTYHRIIESFKYAYAKRTELGDLNFVNITDLLSNLTSTKYTDSIRMRIDDNSTSSDPKHYGAVYYSNEDHGTAHFSIIAPNGDAVSVTSSINIYFGAGMTSKQTGIILNSVMDDFSFPYFKNYFGLPGSPNNQMKAGKRPLSSMSPTIITDKNGEVKMVVGASGGTKITTTVAQVIMRALWFGENIKEAVDAPRIHHQLYPMRVDYEYGTLQQVVDGLQALGHNLTRESGSVICALFKEANRIIGNADYRKGGEVYGIM
ncbi:glutathione hydrolase 1 proenzyme isoform X2 [Anoplophora glabripennis]|uniref:glutathione hydrolase 1 proenzyme isoform X2 n=1 Tax=Anoplophora glabripennis TaxID=217634 RepID=UPI000874301F|nr:glutathione hydrolase 1 proenzyme isoform X2 [Anoplophora glabripennis]